MKEQQSHVGSNVVKLSDYRSQLQNTDSPHIRITIEDGELVSQAAHVRPDDVPLLLSALAKMSGDLQRFYEAARTACVCLGVALLYLYTDAAALPAFAFTAHSPTQLDLAEGHVGNMHKCLAENARMVYDPIQVERS